MKRPNDTQARPSPTYGKLAMEHLNVHLPLEILQSQEGFYIGTANDEGPCSRESEEYFPGKRQAE